MVSPRITVDVIDVEMFPELGRRYEVSGIPKTIINDKVEFVGAAPEEFVVQKILSLDRR